MYYRRGDREVIASYSDYYYHHYCCITTRWRLRIFIKSGRGVRTVPHRYSRRRRRFVAVVTPHACHGGGVTSHSARAECVAAIVVVPGGALLRRYMYTKRCTHPSIRFQFPIPCWNAAAGRFYYYCCCYVLLLLSKICRRILFLFSHTHTHTHTHINLYYTDTCISSVRPRPGFLCVRACVRVWL
jgi:hypothetical protein